MKKLKVLSMKGPTEYISLSFSSDPTNMYLLSIGGEPDYTMVLWAWDKSKPIVAMKLNTEVFSAVVSPYDSAQISACGSRLFRLWRLVDGQLKGFNLLASSKEYSRKSTFPDLTDHLWISNDLVIASSTDGSIFVIDGLELKKVLANALPDNAGVLCLARYSKGFVCGGKNGHVSVYEKTSDLDYFMQTKTMKISDVDVTSISIPLNSETAFASTSSSQIVSFSTSTLDPSGSFLPLFNGVHSGPVKGLDIALKRPMIVTCGSDKVVRLFNYSDSKCEISRLVDEEPLTYVM